MCEPRQGPLETQAANFGSHFGKHNEKDPGATRPYALQPGSVTFQCPCVEDRKHPKALRSFGGGRCERGVNVNPALGRPVGLIPAVRDSTCLVISIIAEITAAYIQTVAGEPAQA